MSSIDHAMVASIGCCIGHTSIRADGLGLPKRSRHAAATALIGFQLAIGCIQPGSPCVGTNAFDTNVSGRNTMNAVACAVSTLDITMPRHAPHQLIANANSNRSANAASASASPLL